MGRGDEKEDLVISFDEDDHRELERISAKFTDSLKDVIPKLAHTTAQRVLRGQFVDGEKSATLI